MAIETSTLTATLNGVNVYGTASYSITASYALNGGAGTLDTSSFVKTSQTASMTVATASFAVSASYAPAAPFNLNLTNRYIPTYSGSALTQSMLLAHDGMLYTDPAYPFTANPAVIASPMGLVVNSREPFDSPAGWRSGIGIANAFIDNTDFFGAETYTFRTLTNFREFGIKATNGWNVVIGDYSGSMAANGLGYGTVLEVNSLYGFVSIRDRYRTPFTVNTEFDTVSIGDATSYPHIRLSISGSTAVTGSIHMKSDGIIMTTPNGLTQYRISIDNSGGLTTTLVP